MQMTIEIEVQGCDSEDLTLEINDAPVSDSVAIDDNAGIGDTDVTWSADKSASELSDKVDKEDGKSLVYDTEIEKLSTVEQYAQKNTVNSVAGKQGDILLDKSDVGLSAVDNTADSDKPVSTVVAAALADKVDKVEGYSLVDDAEIAKLATVQENATANRDDAQNADKVHDHTVSQVVGLSDRLDSIDSLIGDVESVLVAINGEP